jgi:hypothetical protein
MMFARVDGVTAERSGERTVVLNADGTVLSTLSPVGTIVWEALPGERTALLEQLKELFPDIDEDSLDRDLDLFIDELVTVELITRVDAAS